MPIIYIGEKEKQLAYSAYVSADLLRDKRDKRVKKCISQYMVFANECPAVHYDVVVNGSELQRVPAWL